MFDRERRICRFLLDGIEMLLGDVSEEELGAQPVAGMNPPRWILGHLAVVTDAAMRLVGGEPALPAAWHSGFGPGSKLGTADAPRPSKVELLSALRSSHERLLAGIDATDEALFEKPHGITFASLDQAFPTRGDLLSNLLTGHLGLHAGQLSAWRRATGRPALF